MAQRARQMRERHLQQVTTTNASTNSNSNNNLDADDDDADDNDSEVDADEPDDDNCDAAANSALLRDVKPELDLTGLQGRHHAMLLQHCAGASMAQADIGQVWRPWLLQQQVQRRAQHLAVGDAGTSQGLAHCPQPNTNSVPNLFLQRTSNQSRDITSASAEATVIGQLELPVHIQSQNPLFYAAQSPAAADPGPTLSDSQLAENAQLFDTLFQLLFAQYAAGQQQNHQPTYDDET